MGVLGVNSEVLIFQCSCGAWGDCDVGKQGSSYIPMSGEMSRYYARPFDSLCASLFALLHDDLRR